jgi:hypothetical protein
VKLPFIFKLGKPKPNKSHQATGNSANIYVNAGEIEDLRQIINRFNTVDLSFFLRYRYRYQTLALFFSTLSIKVHGLNNLN